MTERDLFLALLDIADPAGRLTYLETNCAGDAALRARVEGLLKSHDHAGSFLGRPVLASGHMDGGATQDLGDPDGLEDADHNNLPFLQPSTRADSLGRIGHYEVLQVLGKGGFGIVFRAFDELLQRVVALKVLAPAIAATSPARKRFLREARSSAQVRHDNVVQVYDVAEQPVPHLVMEFIPGETLQQRLNRMGPLDVLDIARIGRQIAEGLAAAHATNLIHRDIKPANVLLESGQDRVKITDFGLARAADDASLTQSGMVAGTPMYMAPEQVRGETLDHRTDLFSLGSVMYVLATGRPPFRASTTYAVLQRVVEDEPRPIRDVIPEVPEWLCTIIERLQAKEREKRFQTAQEVADLLAQRMRDEGRGMKEESKPVSIHPSSLIPHPFLSRRWVAAAAVLLLLLGSFVVTEATGVTEFHGLVLHLLAPEDTPVAENTLPANLANPDEETPDSKKKAPPAPGTEPAPGKEPAPGTEPMHDTWLKAVVLLPPDQQGSAVATKMKEQLPGFGEALLKAIPAMSADRQAIMVDVWLKERKPAFAGLEDAWLKTIPTLPAGKQAVVAELWLKECRPAFAGFEDAWLKALPVLPVDTQAVVLASWLKERNPAFDGSLTHKPEGNAIAHLEVPSPAVQDLMPLRALPGLKTLICRSTAGWDNKAESDAAVLLSLKTLEKINGKPVAEFWKDVHAKRADFNDWLKLIPTLTAKLQGDAVAAKIKEHNPDFDGKVTRKIDDGVVTELTIFGSNLTDLSPLRALTGLRTLLCDQKVGGNVLSDLSPVKDLKLTSLTLRYLPVSDLSPLKDMKLTSLNLYGTRVTDLAPLKDNTTILTLNLGASPVSDLAPLKDNRTLTTLNLKSTKVTDLAPLKDTLLTSLHFGRTRVKDLSPLKDMPLTTLICAETWVEDLTPLKDLKLTSLNIYSTQVADLGPLQGMPLAELNCKSTKVTNLLPLKDLPLKTIQCDFQPDRDAKILRAIKSLEMINGKQTDEFWSSLEKK